MKRKRDRLVLLACVCSLWCLWPMAAQAGVSVGPFAFDDLAFADKAVQMEPGHIDLFGASNLDDALTGFTPTAGIVNVGYLNNANLFQLEFLDRMAVNGAGSDIVFFDARFSCNAYAVSVREFGGGYSQFIEFPASKFVNTLVSGPGGATIYGLPLDLGAFGLASGAIVDAIRFRALPGSNGVTEGDPVMAGVLKGHTISVADTGFSPLPDTGKHGYSDHDGGIPAPNPGEAFYGQDGHYQGREPAYRDNKNGTVTDLNTGLIWQKGTRENNFIGIWAEALDYCQTLLLGGKSDWRLPTRMELLTLTDYGSFDLSFDERPFPPGRNAYWSSSKGSSNPELRWMVDFLFGTADQSSRLADTMCVSGAPLSPGEYVDNRDGSIWDITTGLVWQQSDDGALRNWEEALSYCQALTLAGFEDWWLPDVRELSSIVDERRTGPALNRLFDSHDGSYWTGTPSSDCASEAYEVDFSSGKLSIRDKTDNFFYARCVRHPPLTPKIRFAPVADATITSSSPTKNYGSVNELETDGSPLKRFLLKFSISGIGTRQVANATLYLYCTDSSDHGGDIHRAENAWTEGSVTWKTAPSFDPTVIASLGPVSRDSWVSIDVTSVIAGDDTYSLCVTSSSKEGADYRSREKPGLSPQLVVTLK
jgi:hypothetical protein